MFVNIRVVETLETPEGKIPNMSAFRLPANTNPTRNDPSFLRNEELVLILNNENVIPGDVFMEDIRDDEKCEKIMEEIEVLLDTAQGRIFSGEAKETWIVIKVSKRENWKSE